MRLHHNDNKALWSLLAIAIVAGYIGSRLEWHHSTGTGNGLGAFVASALGTDTPNLPVPRLTLGFAGDVNLDGSIKQSVAKNSKGDYSQLFANAEFLHEPDITFANLQSPGSTAVIPTLKAAGISVVSLANSQIASMGRPALEDTLTRVRESGMLACGAGMNKAEAIAPATIDQNGFRIGYLCFSANSAANMTATQGASGILLASDPDFDNIVAAASHNVNALVVSFDWGSATDTAHAADQEALAQKAVNDGAAIVIGTGPQASEDVGGYMDRPVIYSLGTFMSGAAGIQKSTSGNFMTASLVGPKIVGVQQHAVSLDSNYAISIQQNSDLTPPQQ